MRKEFLYTDSVFIIHDFLSPKECDVYIARGEEIGFSEAPVTTFGGPQMRKDIRNNTRVMLDDPELSAQIFERAPLIA